MQTNKNGETGNASVLTVWLNIAGFNMTFVQFKTTSQGNGASGKSAAGVKRILRISVDQIPLMKDIPLVGELPQPFDHLEYLWVEDDSTGVDPSFLGITREELDQIGKQYPKNIPAIQVQDSKPPESAGTRPDLVLQAGHHFMVVIKGKVVLDHVFHMAPTTPSDGGKNKDKDASSAPKKEAGAAAKANDKTGSNTDVKPAEAAPTKGNTNTKAGPLSISGLTFQFKNPSLFVTVDATLQLGPITFAVIGFTLEIELAKVKLDDLAAIVTQGLIHVSLHGIECGVSQGPLTLEGVFIHDVTTEMETYSGGIAVGFTAWQVLAVGQYAIMKAKGPGDDGFRAVFVYGKLDGPLIELEFATISGVRLGFGYNYAIRMPSLSELYSFPFINDSASAGSGADPLKVLDAMVLNDPHFVYPKEGSCWFCAGMTIKAFDLLTLTAVLLFDITTSGSDAGVLIALIADGVFQMEPRAKPDYSLFYIEVVLSVELNFGAGYIAANAVMAPASHVYVPQAHLTGSASFYTWFGSNSHAGDWVVSVGGYARGYAPPAHYPSPDRVGLNFIVGDMIHVVGEGYLAITPKCAMAGGLLHMSLSVGPVDAILRRGPRRLYQLQALPLPGRDIALRRSRVRHR